MQANKTTLTLKIEVLHPDVLPGMLLRVADELRSEVSQGNITMEDGDSAEWKTTAKKVSF